MVEREDVEAAVAAEVAAGAHTEEGEVHQGGEGAAAGAEEEAEAGAQEEAAGVRHTGA